MVLSLVAATCQFRKSIMTERLLTDRRNGATRKPSALYARRNGIPPQTTASTPVRRSGTTQQTTSTTWRTSSNNSDHSDTLRVVCESKP